MSARVALVTGASGQDGTLLSERLRAGGTEVVGVCRGTAPARTAAAARVVSLDIRDFAALDRLVEAVAPDECYHLAAHHRSSAAVPDAGDDERDYLDTNLLATHNLLRAVRRHHPRCRVFFAGSCHMFGDTRSSPQTEDTPFAPNSAYGITKVAATQLGRLYREQHGVFACTGILYNHESPLRGPTFVSSRVVRGAVEIARGLRTELLLGSLDARVDWGYAGDYVEAMRRMLAADAAEDLIIASGELHSVRELVELAFARVGLDWTRHVREDPAMHRPVSRTTYLGDPTRIRQRLGWTPSTSFAALVALLVDAELAR